MVFILFFYFEQKQNDGNKALNNRKFVLWKTNNNFYEPNHESVKVVYSIN